VKAGGAPGKSGGGETVRYSKGVAGGGIAVTSRNGVGDGRRWGRWGGCWSKRRGSLGNPLGKGPVAMQGGDESSGFVQFNDTQLQEAEKKSRTQF